MYYVTKQFVDVQDSRRAYRLNDWYPRHAFKPSESHIERLMAGGYIAPYESDDNGYPVHVGGGWYELSNGEKVKGKKTAEEIEQTL